MKKQLFLTAGACGMMLLGALNAKAQEVVDVAEESVTVVETNTPTRYYTNSGQNRFLQIGAGINVPFVENSLIGGDAKRHITAGYNIAFGKWFSPYLGWRMSFLGGAIHWDNATFSKAKYVNANLDFMWDIFNSFGVNQDRTFSIIPFVGLGGTFTWDFKGEGMNIRNDHGKIKHNQWTLPVSAGLQLRFRLCKYADFFVEGRAQFYGDNFNNCAYGRPVDVNITAIGGFTFTFGGRSFNSFNPGMYDGYIAALNDQVNDLRGQLATTTAALVAAESRKPTNTVRQAPVVTQQAPTPLMATVRFRINSSKISDEEMVNVYNIARWMKAYPDQNVTITGYADKDTGTAAYNKALSKRRAEAVQSALVNDYGIDPDRLSMQAEGSDSQPYDVNNWNRIVIFSQQ